MRALQQHRSSDVARDQSSLDQAIYSQFGGVVLDDAEGCAIVDALGDKQTVILVNHGILTTGASIEAAVCPFPSSRTR